MRGAWWKAAERGLLVAYRAAGGPCPQGDRPFLGRGAAVIRTRVVGGRTPGRLHRSARADEVDTANCHVFFQFFLCADHPFSQKKVSGRGVLKRHSQSWTWYCEVARFDAQVGGSL